MYQLLKILIIDSYPSDFVINFHICIQSNLRNQIIFLDNSFLLKSNKLKKFLVKLLHTSLMKGVFIKLSI